LVIDEKEKEAREQFKEDIRRLGWTSIGGYYNQISAINAKNLQVAQHLPKAVGPDATVFSQIKPEQFAIWFNNNKASPVGISSSSTFRQSSPGGLDAVLAQVFPANFFHGKLIELAKGDILSLDDPMGELVSIGQGLTNMAQYAVGASITLQAGGGLIEKIPFAGGFVGKLIEGTVPFITLFAVALFVIGTFFSVLIPFLPWVVVVTAVFGWLYALIEAILAAPLFAAAHMRMDGEGISGGLSTGWKMLLNVMLRPPLIVIGFFFGHVAFAIILKVLLVGIALGSASMFEASGMLTQLTTGIAVFAFTAILAWTFAIKSFQLTWELPEMILAWIDARGSSHRESGVYDKAVMTAGALGYGSGAIKAAQAGVGGLQSAGGGIRKLVDKGARKIKGN
jgi:conjugal transfer/type IV secretion protein DotA/TraY